MRNPRIERVERIWVRNPFDETIAPWLRINNAGWDIVEVIRVHTEDAEVQGIGETLVYYTGRVHSDESTDRIIGLTVAQALHGGHELGMALRMALYDALGKQLGLPLHALFGRPQVRDRVPLSWWSTKMPPALLAAEALRAHALGYRSHKIKARPWFDVFEQIDAVTDAVDGAYALELDWNSMLVDSAHALPVLRELDENPGIALFETPVDRQDTRGHRRLRESLRTPLLEHYDPILARQWLADDALDGFVVEAVDPSTLFAQADVISAFRKDCFLQTCGTGLTTAWVIHLASICAAARLPAVTSHNIYAHDLVTDLPAVRDGHLPVPEGHGLGVSLDEDWIDAQRIEVGTPPANVRRILDFSIPGWGTRRYVTAKQLWDDCTQNATFPVQARGARLDLLEDNNTAEFAAQFAAVRSAPQFV